MNRKIIALVVGLMVIFGGAYWLSLIDQSSPSGEQSTTASTDQFKQDYPTVSDDHRFVYVSGEQAVATLESGNGIVFLGFKECPWCQALAPQVDAAAKAEGLDEIYYLDIRQARADNDEVYQKLVNVLEKYLEVDEAGQSIIYVPDVSAVRQGEIVGRFKMEPTDSAQPSTPEAYWSDQRRQAASVELKGMIQATR